jgi:hypothetical protein
MLASPLGLSASEKKAWPLVLHASVTEYDDLGGGLFRTIRFAHCPRPTLHP